MPRKIITLRRHSIRLKGYDYSQTGLYFITICCQGRKCRFGKIENGEMVLNDAGKMATQCWLNISEYFPHVILHEFVIMPNHIHGIIELSNNNDVKTGSVGAKNFSPLHTFEQSTEQSTEQWAKNFSSQRPRGTSRTIGSIVRGFKIGVTKQLGCSVWQRNYYEHIIRDEISFQHIQNYINNNPKNWENDHFLGTANQNKINP